MVMAACVFGHTHGQSPSMRERCLVCPRVAELPTQGFDDVLRLSYADFEFDGTRPFATLPRPSHAVLVRKQLRAGGEAV